MVVLKKKAEQGLYWEYDRNFNNKKFEDEFNKKFRKDLKNIILKMDIDKNPLLKIWKIPLQIF